MTDIEVKNLFSEAIKERGVYKKIAVTSDVVYNWKNNRGAAPTLGQMLETLFRLNLIKVTNVNQ